MNKWLFLPAAVVIGGYFATLIFAKSPASSLTPALIQDATIIDVRTPGEYQAGHVKGAKNIPLDQLPSAIPQLKKEKRTIIVYCRSGQRSGQAISILKKAGISALNGVNQGKIEAVTE
jgi:phage shock protein E